MSAIKKKREKFFSNAELSLLIEGMKENIHILENKKTDNSSNKAKKHAWLNISNLFNETPETSGRTPEQLEKKWKALKSVST